MNAVLMDDVYIGKESIVGALAFVPAETRYEARSLIVGNPAKKIKEVSESMVAWKTKGTGLYQQLPEDCRKGLREVEPLRKAEADRRDQEALFATWKKNKK